MRLQKQLSKRTKEKDYHRYVVVIPEDLIKQSGLKEGDELQGTAQKDEIKLKKA